MSRSNLIAKSRSEWSKQAAQDVQNIVV